MDTIINEVFGAARLWEKWAEKIRISKKERGIMDDFLHDENDKNTLGHFFENYHNI